ncbi:hypothetical protein UCDDS831_g02465 [Diplodia seriata]|uniref:Uncharacterized protein n=1 Tax=Diplodia seriata TaxID=420778 RepID=A0A0G2ENT9_9PEZI|nr:hypothetical protein UCDDS831_g02465 [Diplodia seriata]
MDQTTNMNPTGYPDANYEVEKNYDSDETVEDVNANNAPIAPPPVTSSVNNRPTAGGLSSNPSMPHFGIFPVRNELVVGATQSMTSMPPPTAFTTSKEPVAGSTQTSTRMPPLGTFTVRDNSVASGNQKRKRNSTPVPGTSSFSAKPGRFAALYTTQPGTASMHPSANFGTGDGDIAGIAQMAQAIPTPSLRPSNAYHPAPGGMQSVPPSANFSTRGPVAGVAQMTQAINTPSFGASDAYHPAPGGMQSVPPSANFSTRGGPVAGVAQMTQAITTPSLSTSHVYHPAPGGMQNAFKMPPDPIAFPVHNPMISGWDDTDLDAINMVEDNLFAASTPDLDKMISGMDETDFAACNMVEDNLFASSTPFNVDGTGGEQLPPNAYQAESNMVEGNLLTPNTPVNVGGGTDPAASNMVGGNHLASNSPAPAASSIASTPVNVGGGTGPTASNMVEGNHFASNSPAPAASSSANTPVNVGGGAQPPANTIADPAENTVTFADFTITGTLNPNSPNTTLYWKWEVLRAARTHLPRLTTHPDIPFLDPRTLFPGSSPSTTFFRAFFVQTTHGIHEPGAPQQNPWTATLCTAWIPDTIGLKKIGGDMFDALPTAGLEVRESKRMELLAYLIQ